MLIKTARVTLLALAVSLGLPVLAAESSGVAAVQKVDLSPDRQRIRAPRNEAAHRANPPGLQVRPARQVYRGRVGGGRAAPGAAGQ